MESKLTPKSKLSLAGSLPLVVVLGGVTAFDAMAIDMYLPAFAEIGRSMGTDAGALGHRFAVTFDPAKGSVDFGGGQSVALSASDTVLSVTVHDETAAGLDKLEQVVADHLKRFAFRETLEFNWSRRA